MGREGKECHLLMWLCDICVGIEGLSWIVHEWMHPLLCACIAFIVDIGIGTSIDIVIGIGIGGDQVVWMDIWIRCVDMRLFQRIFGQSLRSLKMAI